MIWYDYLLAMFLFPSLESSGLISQILLWQLFYWCKTAKPKMDSLRFLYPILYVTLKAMVLMIFSYRNAGFILFTKFLLSNTEGHFYYNDMHSMKMVKFSFTGNGPSKLIAIYLCIIRVPASHRRHILDHPISWF